MGSESIEAVTISKSSSSSSSAAGEKFFPPGFRFHPTDEELVLYYLKRKICGRSLKLDIIGEVDVYKWDPQDLPGQSKWKTGDRQWFFFSPRDRKYPNGGRSNRGTMHGYWKATGKDRIIKCNSRVVGLKKTLVYYQGRAPSGQRTDWVMHEYTLDEEELKRCSRYTQEYYALYKVFKKSGPGPKNGEQYGAPFVEEEWANDDDEYLDVDALLVHNINTLVKEPKLSSGITVEPEIFPSVAQIKPVNSEKDSQQSLTAYEPSVIICVEELQPLVVNDDFLEMDDLISPLPAFQNSQLPVLDDLQFADFNGFCAFDFYNEMDPFESQQPTYTNNTDFQTGYDPWTHDQMAAQTTDATISPPSGMVTNEKPGKPDCGEIECRKMGVDDGSDSWFSSALWAFVESVPTSPASALESNDLVNNKVFERIPGFSIMSYDNEASDKCTSVTRRVKRSSRLRGIVYFSVLGVLFVILCVFVGTSIELLGRCILS